MKQLVFHLINLLLKVLHLSLSMLLSANITVSFLLLNLKSLLTELMTLRLAPKLQKKFRMFVSNNFKEAESCLKACSLSQTWLLKVQPVKLRLTQKKLLSTPSEPSPEQFLQQFQVSHSFLVANQKKSHA